MEYIHITNNPKLARYSIESGVHRIFVDLEVNGKYERQGHLDTLISQHSFSDIRLVKESISNATLMVRLNPLYKGSQSEVDQAIELGADLLMLPMFQTAQELREFSKMVRGRVGIIPLVETHSAMLDMHHIVKVPGLSEIYIGLNDLHIDMGLKFMFEPLANGMIDQAVEVIKQSSLPFGFGGVARVGEGLISGELVLAEHVRLGSSSVILSRTFNRNGNDIENTDLKLEINKLNLTLKRLRNRDNKQTESDRQNMKKLVNEIIKGKL